MKAIYIKATYVFLDSGHLNDTLIYGAFSDETIDGDLARLSQTVSTVHGLRVIGGVPVVIIEYDRVGSSQVDTKTACTSTQKEHEDIRSAKQNKIK